MSMKDSAPARAVLTDIGKEGMKMKTGIFKKIICASLLLAAGLFLAGCSKKGVSSEKLREQMNAFLSAAEADGSLAELEDSWFTVDAEKKKLDFSVLTGENGTIVFGTVVTKPFSCKSGDSYGGIVPEIMLRFARENGYKLEFRDFADTNSLVLAVSAGKCDMGGSTVSITEERKKRIDYSDPYFYNSCVIAMNSEDAAGYADLSSLAGKRLGVSTGGITHDIAAAKIQNVEIFEYSSPADMCQALLTKKIDAFAHDLGVVRYALLNYETEQIVDTLYDDDIYGFVFPKNNASGAGLWEKIRDGFDRTVLQENRWKMILEGIGTTILITVMAILFGTVFGFLLCMAYRAGRPFAVKLIDGFSWLVRGLPTVVLLLIMYYVVFGATSISGTVVSIVSFSIIFAVTVCGLLTSGIRTVDRGQFEACAALGYSEKDGFMKIILPQVIRFALPGFKTEVIALIKATSIVGYIAVQDLTKTGDIIRSSTYEAFAPLILTAVVYFLLAWILTKIVDLLEKAVLKNGSMENFLKGVDRHAGN